MENHPETPISNRGFNAQFLSIVPYSTPPCFSTASLPPLIPSESSSPIQSVIPISLHMSATTRLFSCSTVSRIIPGGCWDSTT